jgi:hypothetical protein
MSRDLLVALLCVAVPFTLPSAQGQTGGRRQYYNAWAKHPTKSYYYRTYYYKKSARSSYSYHYAIYYPSRGKRVYMYNPHKKRYWGYWEGDKYSLLDPKHRRESINDISAEWFPAPGKPPAIPEADDGEKMVPPPTDFPKLDDDKP